MSVLSSRRAGLVVAVVLILAIFVGPGVALAQTSPPAAEPAPAVAFLDILIKAFLAAATPILAAFVIGWMRQLAAKAKASVSAEQWMLLESLAATVVAAAEQSGLSKQISDAGKEKKAWAINELIRLASEHGLYGLNIATYSNIIEAEVLRQFNQPASPVPLIQVTRDKIEAQPQ